MNDASPTRVDGLWHSTAMVASYHAILDPLQRLFGAVVMHDHHMEQPEVGRRGGMVWLGDNSIEIGAPAGDRSPVRKFVERLGGGMHSIAMRTSDIQATRSWVRSQGAHVGVAIGDHVFFTRPDATHGLLLEWSAMHTDDDPRFGFEPPYPKPEAPVAPARRYGFVTAAVADPVAAGERLAALFGTEVLRSVPGAGPAEIGAMVSLGDCVLVLHALPEAPETWPWGNPPARPRFHGHGLVVDDLTTALRNLADVGIAPVAELEHAVLLDASAGPVPTFVCDELFAEDPRR
jgi:catechol 2,3-dioxygenase-like lactoylglutathione lyase family enzyme